MQKYVKQNWYLYSYTIIRLLPNTSCSLWWITSCYLTKSAMNNKLAISRYLLLSFNVLMHQNEGINLYIKATSIWSIGKNTNDQNNNSLHLTARAITQFHIERTLRSSYCILFLSQSIALILIYKKEKTVHIQWTRNVFFFFNIITF